MSAIPLPNSWSLSAPERGKVIVGGDIAYPPSGFKRLTSDVVAAALRESL